MLSFVTFADQATSTDVIINTVGVTEGYYTLVLESYDSAGGVYSTLKTDSIVLTVTKHPCLSTTIVIASPSPFAD